ncbi:hypothetical protein [Leptospira fluminis]|nr:hypothetical protein [Leptospira fluminis]
MDRRLDSMQKGFFPFLLILLAGLGAYFMFSPRCIDGNCRDGKGTKYLPGRYRYEGNFKEGLADGKGKLVLESGESYEGSWVRGHKEGQGTYLYMDGSKYAGSWKANKRDGEGTLTDSDGTVLRKGTWKVGEFESK